MEEGTTSITKETGTVESEKITNQGMAGEKIEAIGRKGETEKIENPKKNPFTWTNRQGKNRTIRKCYNKD